MKILVAYNGSEESKRALELASDHAKITDGTVYVMTSMEGGTGETLEEITEAKLNLDFAQESLEKEGIQCEVNQMARGLSPGEDIIRFSEENEIDHIFVGIEKKSKTRKLLLGSTAQYIILKADCPVTTIR